MPETWDLLDQAGQPTGEIHQRGGPLPPARYHLAVHLWACLPDGRLLLQQRATTIEHHPGKWGLTGGSALAGESSLVAVRRECQEELGRPLPVAESNFVMRSRMDRVFMDSFLVRVASPFSFSPTPEVDAIEWVTAAELIDRLGKGWCVPMDRAYVEAMVERVGGIPGFP